MSYEEKRTRLQANRAALIQQHASLTEQMTQATIGLHQIDGAIAILGEMEAEAAAAVDGVLEPTPPASRNGPAKRSAV